MATIDLTNDLVNVSNYGVIVKENVTRSESGFAMQNAAKTTYFCANGIAITIADRNDGGEGSSVSWVYNGQEYSVNLPKNAIICGGGWDEAVVSTDITMTGGNVHCGVFGGGVKDTATVGTAENPGSVTVTVTGGEMFDGVVGGGINGAVYGNIDIIVGDTEGHAPKITANIIGGGFYADVTGDINLTINNVIAGDGVDSTFCCGGGVYGNVNGDIAVNMNGGDINGVLAAGSMVGGAINGNTTVNMNGGAVDDLAGGGAGYFTATPGTLTGDTKVNLYGGTVRETLSGGSCYKGGSIVGNTEVNIYGGTVGVEDRVTGHNYGIFGGSCSTAANQGSTVSGTATVNIITGETAPVLLVGLDEGLAAGAASTTAVHVDGVTADMSTIQVNAAWTGTAPGKEIVIDGKSYYYGINAFSDPVKAYSTGVAETTEIVLQSDVSANGEMLGFDNWDSHIPNITYSGNYTINFAAAGKEFGGGIYAVGQNKSVTISEEVTIANAAQLMAAYSGSQIDIAGSVTAMQLWAGFGSTVNITETADVTLTYGDGWLNLRGGGTVNITGNLVSTDGDIALLPAQVKVGYVSVGDGTYGGSNTLTLTNTFMDGGAWLNVNAVGNNAFNLNHSIFKTTALNVYSGTVSLSNASRIVVSKSVIAADAVVAVSDSTIEAGSIDHSGTITLSGSTLIADSMTGNGTVLLSHDSALIVEGGDGGNLTVNADLSGYTGGRYRLVSWTGFGENNYVTVEVEPQVDYAELSTVNGFYIYDPNQISSVLHVNSAFADENATFDAGYLPAVEAFEDVGGAFSGINDTTTAIRFGSDSGTAGEKYYAKGYAIRLELEDGVSDITLAGDYFGGRPGPYSTPTASNLTVAGGNYSGAIYGGSNNLASKSITLNIEGPVTADRIYGGGSNSNVDGDIRLSLAGGRVNNIYGAGENCTVSGNLLVDVTGIVTVTNDLLGESSGSTVNGTATLNVAAGASLAVGNTVSGFDAVTLNATSQIRFGGTFTNNGTVTVDMAGAAEGLYKLIDNTGSAAMTVTDYNVTLANATGYNQIVSGNDLYATSREVVSGNGIIEVDAEWASFSDGELVIGSDGRIYTVGVNAFGALQGAVNAAADDGATINVASGIYADAADITADAVGKVKTNLTIQAVEGADVVFSGTVTIGQSTPQTQIDWNGGLTIKGIDFDCTANTGLVFSCSSHINIVGCDFYGTDGKTMINSLSTAGGAGDIRFADCDFGVGYVTIYRANTKFGERGMEFFECRFVESQMNIQGGALVELNSCDFNKTVTDAANADNFYVIRSNDTAVKINDCVFNIDSSVTTATPAGKNWAVFWQRMGGSTQWNITDSTVTFTDAARANTYLLLDYNATSVAGNAFDRVTFTGTEVAELLDNISGYVQVYDAATRDYSVYNSGTLSFTYDHENHKVNSDWAGSVRGQEVILPDGTTGRYGFDAFATSAEAIAAGNPLENIVYAAGRVASYDDAVFASSVKMSSNGDGYATFGLDLGQEEIVFKSTATGESTSSEIAAGSKFQAASIGTRADVDGAYVEGVSADLLISGEVVVGKENVIGDVWNRQNSTMTVADSGKLTVLGGQFANRGDVVVYGSLERTVWLGTGQFALAGTSAHQGSFTLDGGSFTETSANGQTSLVTFGENTAGTAASTADFCNGATVSLVSDVKIASGSKTVVTIDDSSFRSAGSLTVGKEGELVLKGASFVTFAGIENRGIISVTGTSTLAAAVAGGRLNFGTADQTVDATFDATGQSGNTTVYVRNGTVALTGVMAAGNQFYQVHVGSSENDLAATLNIGSAADTTASINTAQSIIGHNTGAVEQTVNVYGSLNASASIYTKEMGNLNVYGKTSAQYVQAAGQVAVSGANARLFLSGNNLGSTKIGTDVAGKRGMMSVTDHAEVTANTTVEVGYDSGSRIGDLVLSDFGRLNAAAITVAAGSAIAMDYTSTLKFDTIANAGTITIDTAGFENGVHKILDSTGTMDETAYKALLGDGNWNQYYTVESGDLYLAKVDMATIAVDADWAGKTETGAPVIVDGTTYFYGFNAFASVKEAFDYTTENTATLALVGETGMTADYFYQAKGNVEVVSGDGSPAMLKISGDEKGFYAQGDADATITFSKEVALNATGQVMAYGSNIEFNNQVNALQLWAVESDVTVNADSQVILSDQLSIRGGNMYVTGTLTDPNDSSINVNTDSDLRWGWGQIGYTGGAASAVQGRERNLMTIKNAVAGSSGGTNIGSASRKSTGILNVENSYFYAGNLTLETAGSKINLTGSRLNTNYALSIAVAEAVVTVSDSALKAATIMNAGRIDVFGASTVTAGAFTNSGAVAMDYTSRLVFTSISNTGTITIDVTGYTGGGNLLLDSADGSMTLGDYKALLGDSWNDRYFTFDNGDLYMNDTYSTVVYVNSTYSESGANDGHTWGVDAFSNVADAKAKAPLNIVTTGGSFADIQGFDGVKSELKDGSFTNHIYGGNGNSDGTIVHNSDLTITSGDFQRVYGGNHVVAASRTAVDINGESSLTISAGTFNGGVFGADSIGGGSVLRTGDVMLNIHGGTFSKTVGGGMFFESTSSRDEAIVGGDVNMTISGGTFSNHIYGGNVSGKVALSHRTTVEGNINLTIDASTNGIVFGTRQTDGKAINIVAGSSGYGTVRGNVSVTVTGDKGIDFSGILSGGGEGAYYQNFNGQRECVSYVEGARTLTFSGFSGDFGGRIVVFDGIGFAAESNVNFTNAQLNLSDISDWDFEFGSGLSGLANNNFAGDSLSFDLSGWDKQQEWDDVMKGGASAFTGWDDERNQVSLGGQLAQWNTDLAGWCSSDYSLSLQDDGENGKKFVIATLAIA